jgi:5'-methylthioadenosine nucleosidase
VCVCVVYNVLCVCVCDCISIDASVKDMEGAGVAWVAHLATVPLVCVKVVTDIVDGEHPTQDEFLQNLSAAAESLKHSLPRVISYVAGKPAHAL